MFRNPRLSSSCPITISGNSKIITKASRNSLSSHDNDHDDDDDDEEDGRDDDDDKINKNCEIILFIFLSSPYSQFFKPRHEQQRQ